MSFDLLRGSVEVPVKVPKDLDMLDLVVDDAVVIR